jgi:hypothetical protein
MLQVFYLDVAYVAMSMLQVYVPNVSSISDICCNCVHMSVAKVILDIGVEEAQALVVLLPEQ